MSLLEGLKLGIDRIFGDYSALDDEFFDSLLETLILSDVGVDTSEEIVSSLRERLYSERLNSPDKVKKALIETISSKMKPGEGAYSFLREKAVILFVGVNGVGKTTSIGKMAYRFYMAGRRTVIAAADTYRAAATEQLRVWAERAHAQFVGGREGIDPASVIYEACDKYLSLDADYLLADTAGRLQNKKNLMEELSKIARILEKKLPGIRHETWLVLDAHTGQNAMSQMKEFSECTDINGIFLSKMDGSAKGGVVIALSSSFDAPVKFIGTGEGISDIELFEPEEFIGRIFNP